MGDVTDLLVVAAVFLLAGTVKGIVGLGLPTVSLALLTLALDLPQAMALMLAPSFVTNLWQALAGTGTFAVLRRIWTFLLLGAVAVGVGVKALLHVNVELLTALLGASLFVYATFGLLGVKPRLGPGQEPWVGPLAGTLNGLLTGMTGSFIVPGVLYLQALGLHRDALIQAMGMLFTVSTLALAVALGGIGLIPRELGLGSGLAIVPALLGMLLGQRLRRHLSETQFRRVFMVAVLLLGIVLILAPLGE